MGHGLQPCEIKLFVLFFKPYLSAALESLSGGKITCLTLKTTVSKQIRAEK